MNQYVTNKLHINGVDLCNDALTRLLSKKERRENEHKLSILQKMICRIAAIDMWDVRVMELCYLVREFDSKVTLFQKKILRELQLADEDYSNAGDEKNDDIVGEVFPADDLNGVKSASCRRNNTRAKRNAG